VEVILDRVNEIWELCPVCFSLLVVDRTASTGPLSVVVLLACVCYCVRLDYCTVELGIQLYDMVATVPGTA
jgi:hypothetical protein